MKVIGISELKDNDEIIISKEFIKYNINIDNINGRIRKIFKITVIPKIVNAIRLEKENYALILLLLKFRILYLVHNDSEIKVYSSSIFKEIIVKTPCGVEIGNSDIGNRYLDKFVPQVKRMKTTIEYTSSISINFWINIYLKCEKLDSYYFLASFDNFSENIFYWDNSKKTLVQKTFFSGNKIISLELDDKCGYILSLEENRNNIYQIEDTKITIIPLLSKGGNIIYLIKALNNLFVAIETLTKVSLYRYNYGKFDLFIDDICPKIQAIYVKNSFIYGRRVNENIEIVRVYYEEKEQNIYISTFEEVIAEINDNINLVKISRDKRRLVILLNNCKILLYDLEKKELEEVVINSFDERIEDIFFTNEKDVILLKIVQNGFNNIIVVYLDKEFYDNITNNQFHTNISSVFTNYDMSYVYLSDDSTYGYNIYRVNMRSLEKELLLELNANSIKFVQ
ncbi:MAG: hypothetical protein ACRC5M_01415 [Anaeroplasmataceae bacterium]